MQRSTRADDVGADDAQGSPKHPDLARSRAFQRDISALLPDLRGFARFLTRDASAADDLVQDTLVRALAAQAQFQPDTNLKAWLFTIQRNAFYEQARRRQRETRVMSARIPPPDSIAPAAAHRAEVADLQRMLFMLPPLLREALVLVGAQELSHEQAAAICGVPVGTMKARVSRARSQLARTVSEAGGA
nr:sigma-70 family RNA polymerase sigma factor [uncultured Lichenicoccus sp.]